VRGFHDQGIDKIYVDAKQLCSSCIKCRVSTVEQGGEESKSIQGSHATVGQ
jgi:hypothetical protein